MNEERRRRVRNGFTPGALLLICLTLGGIAVGTPSASGQSFAPLTAFLVAAKPDRTALSSANSGGGLGSVLQVRVLSIIQLSDLGNRLFTNSAANFDGRGFSALLPGSGTGLLTLQLEGPAGFIPELCFGFRNNNQPIDGGVVCSSSQDSGRVPLAGRGTIVTQNFNFFYFIGSEQPIAPGDLVEFSIAFGVVGSFSPPRISTHYGGATAETTSYFQIPTS